MRTPEYGAHRLEGGAHHIVEGLLSRQRHAACLGVKPKRLRLLILGREPVAHDPSPDAPRGAKLGHLFEKVHVGGEEERDSGREVVHGQARGQRSFDVGDRVAER